MSSSNPSPQSKGSAKIKVVFQGLEPFFKVIEGLPLEMQSSIIAQGVTTAVKPLVRLAKQYAPQDTGALKASIASKVLRSKLKGTAAALMGPSKGYFKGKKRVKKGESRKDAEQPARYAHLVEFGHLTSKGRVGAKPFMRPATAVGSEEVSRAMTVGISSGLNKALKKYKVQTYGN